jgi:hypothetical protein
MDATEFAQEAALRVIEGGAIYAFFRPALVKGLGLIRAIASRLGLTEEDVKAGVATAETETLSAPGSVGPVVLRVIEGAKGGPA